MRRHGFEPALAWALAAGTAEQAPARVEEVLAQGVLVDGCELGSAAGHREPSDHDVHRDRVGEAGVGAGEDRPHLGPEVLAPRRLAFAAALQRGIDEGLVRDDVDLDHAIDLLVGPMAYRNLIRTDPPPGPELAGRIVDDVLVALGPSARRHSTPDLESP